MNAKSPRVYLDHNATSPMRPEVLDALGEAMLQPIGNPASLHAEGRAARARVEHAREQVAALAGASSREVVFTSGGSEAIAAAVRGVCDRAPKSHRRIVVSAVEHSAVLESVRLAARGDFRVDEVSCGREGRIDPGRFAAALGPGVALAALQVANNETGVLQPVDEIGRACRENGSAFLVHAVQAAGKLALDPRRSCADLIALSGHKLGGPQGTGALIVRQGIVLSPLIAGGAQEKRRRGGTPGVAALAGFGAAAEAAQRALQPEAERLLRLRAKIEKRLRAEFPAVRIHGQGVARLPKTANFSLKDTTGEVLAIALDLAGFAVSTGSACASGAVEPSHVIRAMGFDEDEARGAVRVSLGWSTTDEAVDRFLGALPDVVERVHDGQIPV